MSEYVQKFQQLDQMSQQEVLDFMDFLISRRNQQPSSDTDANQEFIHQGDAQSNDDVKAAEQVITRRHKERMFNTIPGLVVYMAEDFDAPLDVFSEYR